MNLLQILYECIIRFYQCFFAWLFNLPFFDANRLVISTKFSEAHIFGSGASINQSKVLAKENAFKMTCNLTVAVLPQWDIVLVEKLGITDYGNKQFSLLMQTEINNIVLKNIYPWHINIKPSLAKKFSNAYILKECQIQQDFDLTFVINKLLMSKDTYYQYASSVITMIMIAKNLNFKKIVLHGLDFNQSSYMDSPEYSYLKPNNTTSPVINHHSTEALPLPVSDVIKSLIDVLKTQNIHIFFANEFL